jgi:ATP-dependent Clp protease adaptor protein ClpS
MKHPSGHAPGTPGVVEGPIATAPVGATAPAETERPDVDEAVRTELPWLVIVWNDPVNLMSYVTFVFQKLFGYSREKAHRLMMDVHTKGRAVVSSGPRERAELDVSRLHQHGLWATMEQSS